MQQLKAESKRATGFTIIEMMMVLAIVAVLAAIGIPSFNTTIKNNRLVAASNEMVGAINFARMEAVRRGSRVHFGAGNGSVGWVVWVDGAGGTINTWDAGEEIRVWSNPAASVSINYNGTTFVFFNGTGLVNTTADVEICDDRTGETGSEINLMGSGVVNRSDFVCS